jgi:tartrate-resistant acid phosphatase type 5
MGVITFYDCHPVVTFVAIGDWGQRTPVQSATAASMAKWASSANATFVVSVGDNFYWTGVANASDPQFDDTWRLVYSAPSLQRPWLSVFGGFSLGW